MYYNTSSAICLISFQTTESRARDSVILPVRVYLSVTGDRNKRGKEIKKITGRGKAETETA